MVIDIKKEFIMASSQEELKVINNPTNCCGGETPENNSGEGDFRESVQAYYAKAAEANDCGCGDQINLYYTKDYLEKLPNDMKNFSLGCGNPISAAELKKGETVLDLGSGGGLDCFLSAKEVGESGHVIGIDMTPEMLERSTESAIKMGFENVEFRKGFLEKMPVEDHSIDVVISNCVINLSADKSLVFDEISRVLKPGGRIAVSDIVINGLIPEEVLKLKDSWNSCAAGALSIDDFTAGLIDAGLKDVMILAKAANGDLLEKNPENELFSAIITARKPGEK